MSRPQPSPTPHWTIPDLIDLEYLLDREPQVDPDFFEEQVEPWILPGKIDRPDGPAMSAALWQWLQVRRRNLNDSDLPGRAFSGAQTLVTLLLVLIMFTSSASLVFGLLRYDGRTYNVLVLLSFTLGLPWLFLLAGLAGYCTWGMWRSSPFISLSQSIVFQLSNRLIRRPLGKDAANWWRETARQRHLFTLPALALTQKAASAYSAGSICALLTAVLFLSIRFGWETTASETVSPTLHQVTRILGAPWSWCRPGWVPTLEEIEQSRITWELGRPRLPDSGLAAVWVPFLTLTLLVWGLCPRLLLLAWASLRERRALRGYSFQDRMHREWWRKLTDFSFEIQVPGPADGAFALLWAGASPPPEDLRHAALRQLRVNIEEQAEAGAGSLEEDARSLEKLRAYLHREPASRIVLVAESWALAPKDLADFLDRLRRVASQRAAIDLFLTGLPNAAQTLSAPPESDVAVWQDFAAHRDDVNLFVRPFRAEIATEDCS